ncbi:MAG TPA: hypothetical protein VNO31_31550 [Umezawaea sp.]|nr:hypothetical protein [Umezawaea sp.]
MNHADRQRLSQLLDTIDRERITGFMNETELAALAEARAIVDAPGPDLILTFTGSPLADTGRIKAAVQAALADQAPSPKLDAFLTEPIHEYREKAIWPQWRKIHHPLGWEPRPTRRHRLKATIGLTLAAIALIALTAANEPTPGPSHQPAPTKPAGPASRTAQTGFRQGDAPWTVQHRPGTPGNGLGVTP